jgi:hypothetical protein
VSSGGTGSANLTVNNVLIGNGTSAVTSVAPGTTGNVLTSIGGAWVSNVALTSVAAGSNTQVQYNSANLLAGSANLTFDGTNLGLAGGTANGVAYLNGSKVLTTGSALTFDGTTLVNTVADGATALRLSAATGKLRVRSYVNSTIGVALESVNAAESAYLPISFYGTNTYTNADTAAIWTVGGSEGMRLTSTGLGIGTSSPGGRLEVVGASQILQRYTGSALGFSIGQYNSSGDASINNGANANLLFATNNTERMRLDSSGNLGLGTTSPSASAILDAQSTTKGVRMPNMTTTQKNAISSPAAGLMVFDTTLAKLCVYSGSAWQTITSV